MSFWKLVILFQLLPAFEVWGQIGIKPGIPYCFMWKEGGNAFTDPNKLIHLFGYFTPLISLIASYIYIHKALAKNLCKREGN